MGTNLTTQFVFSCGEAQREREGGKVMRVHSQLSTVEAPEGSLIGFLSIGWTYVERSHVGAEL